MSQKPVPIQVLLVGSNRIVLWALEKLTEGAKPPMQVVGSVSNCTEALAFAKKACPDVIVLDTYLSEDDGLIKISSLTAGTKAKVLILTGLPDTSKFDDAVLAGAKGIVSTDEPVETILKAIEKIHQGQVWLDRASTGRIFIGLVSRSGKENGNPERQKMFGLTPKERAIVRAIATDGGHSAKAIAQVLHISDSTLRNHLTSIYDKLGVTSRLELYAFAQKHGIGTIPG